MSTTFDVFFIWPFARSCVFTYIDNKNIQLHSRTKQTPDLLNKNAFTIHKIIKERHRFTCGWSYSHHRKSCLNFLHIYSYRSESDSPSLNIIIVMSTVLWCLDHTLPNSMSESLGSILSLGQCKLMLSVLGLSIQKSETFHPSTRLTEIWE